MLALLLALPARAQAEGENFPRAEVQAVLETAFAAVLERHLELVAPGDLAMWTLRGLEVLEPTLTPELNQGTLLLQAPDRLLAARPLPRAPPQAAPEAVAAPLAIAIAALFEAGWRASAVLRQAGVEGLLRSAFEELFNHLDPYSRYLTPTDARNARARRIGASGLGLQIVAGPGDQVVVAGVDAEGPAATAGIRPRDRLLRIDGAPASGRSLGATAALLDGPEDSGLMLQLQRGRRRLDVWLTRRPVPPDVLRAELREGILWLRLEGFAAATDRRLAALLGENFARSPPPRGVVLDLRGNRGGLLSQAVGVAGVFLAGGPVARTSGRHPDATRVYLAEGPDATGGAPLVVLIDGRSASSAEIVAAALEDRGRAAVAGSATTGKGLIQAVIPLPNGGELLVTWSRVLAPRGWPIQGLGVLPELCTSLGAEALAAALVRLRQGQPPTMAAPLARLRAARAPVAASEIAALRATCPAAEGREADQAAARALLDNPAAYAGALVP